MFKRVSLKKILVATIATAAIVGCKKKTPSINPEVNMKSEGQAEHIQVQHILIGFTGTLPGKNIQRTQKDAEKLANEILDRAKKGEDFDGLVKKYSEDRAPGIYGMCNRGVTPQGDEFPRDQMVPAFGEVGFALNVGEVALAPYDSNKSPYGYHIIKRLK